MLLYYVLYYIVPPSEAHSRAPAGARGRRRDTDTINSSMSPTKNRTDSNGSNTIDNNSNHDDADSNNDIARAARGRIRSAQGRASDDRA